MMPSTFAKVNFKNILWALPTKVSFHFYETRTTTSLSKRSFCEGALPQRSHYFGTLVPSTRQFSATHPFLFVGLVQPSKWAPYIMSGPTRRSVPLRLKEVPFMLN